MIFCSSDWHFGIYPSEAKKWVNIMQNYIANDFLIQLKNRAKPGDIFIMNGDLFHNQEAVDILANNTALKLLIQISEILPVHILVGNHDIWAKADNEINSLFMLNYVKDITVHSSPNILYYNNKPILMLPWCKTKTLELKLLKDFSGKADAVFCHSDLSGAATTLRKDFSEDKLDKIRFAKGRNETPLTVDSFGEYKKVYSGHIHIKQQIKNFLFVGSPYQMDRSDMDNEKGFWIIDENTWTEEFIKNKTSPEFMHIVISKPEQVADIDETLIKNNFVDLTLNSDLLLEPKLRKQLNLFQKLPFQKIEYHKGEVWEKVKKTITKDIKSIDTSKITGNSIKKMVINAINDLQLDDITKNNMDIQLMKVFKIYEEQANTTK